MPSTVRRNVSTSFVSKKNFLTISALYTGTSICIFSDQLHSLQSKFQQINLCLILGSTFLARPRRPDSRARWPPLPNSHNRRRHRQLNCSGRNPNQPKKSSKKAQHSLIDPISIDPFLVRNSTLFHPGPFDLSRFEARPV